MVVKGMWISFFIVGRVDGEKVVFGYFTGLVYRFVLFNLVEKIRVVEGLIYLGFIFWRVAGFGFKVLRL